MRGILWRWLFAFGTILWITLCLSDYHKTHIQMHLRQTLKNMEIRIDPPAPPFYQIVPQHRKLQPPKPELTFWKFLSIVLSVSAIVIIKRLSTFRKKSITVSSCSDFDLMRAPYGSFISRVPPMNNNPYNGPIYHQEYQVARFETSQDSGDTRPTALVGVKIVQKKLEDLENNIATLKQRFNSNSTNNPGNSASDSTKRVFEQKLAASQNNSGLVISNTDTHSTISSNSPLSTEMKIRKDILLNHSTNSASIAVTPTVPSNHNSEKNLTPGKLSKNTNSGNSSTKEVKLNQTAYEHENDIISLKELNDSMSSKCSSYGTRKTCPINFEETNENVNMELPPSLKANPISSSVSDVSSKHTSKGNSSRTSYKEVKYQTSQSNTLSGSKTNSTTRTATTCPSISSQKSLEGSSKSFPVDERSSAKMFTDSNSTTTSTLTSIRKKRFLKSMKNRKKELRDLSPISTSIATYMAPQCQSYISRSKHKNDHRGSYAAINKKKAKTMRELRSNTAKISEYDRISVSSSNGSTDSIDKFVAKIMIPDSDPKLMKNSSDDMSMASTSISSLTASSSTFISGGNPKLESLTNSIRSIRSILPLSRATGSSKFSSMGHSRTIPAGAEPLSSTESIVKKSVSKYENNLAIHSLALNYLQTLEQKKLDSDSREKIRDSDGSDLSFKTKSVMERYKSKAKDSSSASSRQNILEDKYWLLHW